ncbi:MULTISPECIES: DUF924 family protein [Salinivibrio]|uniref:DUF924 domain-containing protein n=1 Tax=Salinivibrio siamensis TaxID=414286 RepID=A0ABX3K7F7_9GAMM|nr:MULTISPECIES: DUF924 family protein [Salinivibrio]KKA46089.1 membrane protein [Salinivibrio sp. KP-1]MPS32028.1 DUF924 domain-containing protein [Salinivibrio sp. VYel7]MPX89835.1 DUF924 domain-containing protein [Salinivibrio sp. VYel1]MPX93422.1 DUF924 domain-containing protein [Salinivibrio sp. VYel9]MPX95751.1 DUF924 domain-containing protein [Salinivibrio sp. VYel6]
MHYQDVLAFWFGDERSEWVPSSASQARWFGGSPDVDEAIRERFQSWVSAAGAGALNDWAQTAEGRLALIILLDQFPRNLYRGLAAAYRYDALALALCKAGLAKGDDQVLTPLQRVFFYLPLEHAEEEADQEEALFRFDQLRQRVSGEAKAWYEQCFDYARQHYDIITTFGRFPHRNAVMGRLSTPEERLWLSETDQHFGQG